MRNTTLNGLLAAKLAIAEIEGLTDAKGMTTEQVFETIRKRLNEMILQETGDRNGNRKAE